MSRHFKNIGNVNITLISYNSANATSGSVLGTLAPNEEHDFDGIIRIGVLASDIASYSNFYVNYIVNSSAFQTSTTVNNPTWRYETINNVSYRIGTQYFGTRTTADYVTIQPMYIDGGNTTFTLPEHTHITYTSNAIWFFTSLDCSVVTTDSTYSARFTLDSDDDYSLSNGNLSYSIDGESGSSQTITSGTTSVSFSFNLPYTGTNNIAFTFSGTSLSNAIVIQSNTPNSTLTYIPENPTYGDSISFTVTSNTGYDISSAYIRYTTSLGDLDRIDFTISENKQTATLTFDSSEMSESLATKTVYVYAIVELSESTPTISIEFLHAYILTGENLRELSKKRWYINDSTQPQNVIDLAYYISSMKKFYCNIPSSLTGDMYLAWYDTEINCNVVGSDFVTIDCGSVTVERPNNNVNDYRNTDIQILLPFIGIQTLNSDWIIGNTIHLYYTASTITGDCVAYIEVNNVILYEFTGNISEDIPYTLNNVQWQLKGSISFNSTVLYGFTPILTVFYHENYNDNNTIVISDEKYSLLSDLTGLNYVNDVYLTEAELTDDIKNLIISTLENGVIFG